MAVSQPAFGDLGAMYDDHLRLNGKCIADFLLSLTEPFSQGVMAEALPPNTDRKLAFSLQPGQFDPKFQVEGVVPHQPFFLP